MKTRAQYRGYEGETYVIQLLERAGFILCARNVRVPSGEIDIICERQQRYYCIEVKTRYSQRFGFPEEAITPKKAQRLVRCAEEWMSTQSKVMDMPRSIVCSVLMGQRIQVRFFTVEST